uniref:Uncharacterized protein n=1 Tax=Cucumis melo TaxID=3656 RepID=A0A9I9E8B7_CUCME
RTSPLGKRDLAISKPRSIILEQFHANRTETKTTRLRSTTEMLTDERGRLGFQLTMETLMDERGWHGCGLATGWLTKEKR